MRQESFFKSEAEFVSWLRRRTPRKVKGLALGIGDDAALIGVQRGKEVILTTDLSIKGVHFSSHHPPRAVGHRALARSLSDIAAMGGTPRFALVSLAISPRADRAWLKEFFDGMFALARRFGVVLIGGDTSVVNGPTFADVIVTGEVARGAALLRSGAKPGDRVYVSGRLGLSALGLRLLLSRTRTLKTGDARAIRAHLFPEPQCAVGQFLSARRLASAMMDLSDGLSIDLLRLCNASGVGATLFLDQIPAPALPDREDALNLALHGGEDYQLLFTVPPGKAGKIPRQIARSNLNCIGEIRASRGLDLVAANGNKQPLEPRGYDHFTRISHQ